MRVALVSLEPWDDVWRRNQHLSAALVADGTVGTLAFLEPPVLAARRAPLRRPAPGIVAVPLQLRAPKRLGGLRELGARLRHGALRRADVLWVNDPALGVHCVRRGQPVVYDVTDDWRSYDFPPRIIERIVRAEDELARVATTVVCSEDLARRWSQRYGFSPPVVHNGVDGPAWRAAVPRVLTGAGPHVGYVGTVQAERLDVDLVLRLADLPEVGTLHLIGPYSLDSASRQRLLASDRVELHGPVPSAEVPSWTKALDVLVCPHVVDPFTLSLDAIKSYEYLASGRPVVATPTSGFQHLTGRPGVHVVPASGFAEALTTALGGGAPEPVVEENDWSRRAQQFTIHLGVAQEAR